MVQLRGRDQVRINFGQHATTGGYLLLTSENRQAQNLGLHLQNQLSSDAQSTLQGTLKNLWYDEHRRRLWLSLFAWDRWALPFNVVLCLLIVYQPYGLDARAIQNDKCS